MTTPDAPARMDRRRFVRDLLADLPDTLVITGLGSPSYDVYAADAPAETFYLWGAMGAAVPVSLGVALAQPARSVVAVTGDGEHLMGIGALGTVATVSPPNLTIVVLDNGHFGETGMQQSHTSLGTDLVAVARGFGIAAATQVSEAGQVEGVRSRIRARAGTTYVQALVASDEPPRALPPRDGVANKNAFRASLGFATF